MIAKENARLCKAIGLTSKLLGIYINENLREAGLDLTRNQFIVLKIVNQRQGISQNELAFITERDKTSLTRLISTLDSKNMINRVTSADDRRKKTLFITEIGIKTLNSAWPRMNALEDEISKDITTEEFDNLINVLNKVQTNVLSLENIIQ